MNQVNVMDLLKLFDFDLRTFLIGKRPTNQAELDALTAEVKREVKVKFHALAKQLHPDKGGDAERFKVLSNAEKLIQDNFRLLVQRPQPVVIIYRNYGGYNDGYGYGFSNATTATNSTW
jgi:hypothetical protein